MNTLVIDTATELAILALKTERGNFILSENLGRKHSSLLFEKMDDILARGGVTIEDIDLLGVGIGPGSFTGVRIAVSTGRALSQTLDIPLVGIKSHSIFAHGVNSDEDYILVSWDAKKNRVFGALYKNSRKSAEKQEIIEILCPGDFPPEDLIKGITQGGSVISIGGGYFKYSDRVEEEIKRKSIEIRAMKDLQLSPEKICTLIENIFQANRSRYTDLNNAKPFYARKSDAETARDNKK